MIKQIIRTLTGIAVLLICHPSATTARADDLIAMEPLEPRSQSTDKALFTELPASETGLSNFKNDYSSPEVWRGRWREYLIGPIGTGLSIGDVDGDGWDDLFVVSKDEQSRLYRNRGDFRFTDITESSGFVDSAAPGTGSAFADVDNDGDLDLYCCYVDAPNQLWINDGTGHFTESASIWGVAIATGSVAASFADYDRDGDLDFFLLTNTLQDPNRHDEMVDRLYENHGDRFVEATDASGIEGTTHGHAAIWLDYDQDGWPDLYIANDFSGADKLYRNNGDGTFQDVVDQSMPQVPYYSMGADFGDINNDGRPEVLASDMAATDRIHQLRTVGNHLDIYELLSKGGTRQFAKNTLALNLGNHQFADIAYLAGLARTDWTWAARLVDLDCDGWLDAFFTNGMLRSFHDADLGEQERAIGHQNAMAIVFKREPVMREPNLAFRNLGNLRFEREDDRWGLNKLSLSFGAAFGDLDRDGDLDLVVNHFGEPPSAYRNNQSDHRNLVVELEGQQSNRYGIGAEVRIVSGDLTQCKTLSPSRGYMSTDAPILHFGIGNARNVERLEVAWPSGLRQSFESLPPNRRYRIVEPRTNTTDAPKNDVTPLFKRATLAFPSEAMRKEANFDEFASQPLSPFPQSKLGPPAVCGDVNGDGYPDLVLGGATGVPTTVIAYSPDGPFENLFSLDLESDFGAEDWDLELCDIDDDGDLDLLVASGGVELKAGNAFYENRLYINDGHGYFSRSLDTSFSSARNSSRTLAISPRPIDKLGGKAIFVGNLAIPARYPYSSKSSLWVVREAGIHQLDSVSLGIEIDRRVSGARWSDLDMDGRLDLVVAQEWGPPRFFMGTENGFEERADLLSQSGLAGLWSAVEVADFDGDGRLDVLLGNMGLNTEYQVSRNTPARLWFDRREHEDIRLIETTIDADGQEWLREARGRIAERFPEAMKRSKSFKAYAETSFKGHFPSAETEFNVKSIDNLTTVILWQQSDGRFRFEQLPSLVQGGALRDALVFDATGDGRLDIVSTHALRSPEPWAAELDSGYVCLLENKGGRVFEPILPGESGLQAERSPRALSIADFNRDGQPEIVVTPAEGMPVVFRRVSQ